MKTIFLISLFLSFILILAAGINAYEASNTDIESGFNLKINYVGKSLNYSNNLAVTLKDSGIKYNPQDLTDYSDADYIPLIIKYDSPVEFGVTGQVSDISSYSSNTVTINSIKNVATSKGGVFKTSYKTIPYVAVKIPKNRIKEFTSDFSSLGIKVSGVYVDSHVSAFLNDTTKIIKSDVCTGSTQGCTIYTRESDCTSHGCLWKNGGAGVTIAILDTGVDKTHQDLDDLDDNPSTNDPKVVKEKCFCNNNGPCCPNGQAIDDNAHDGFGHGTHCAAIAAGTGKASNYKFVGVAPKAKILAVKVLDDNGGGTSSDIISGIEWAVANGANIISMSLGTHSGVRDPPMEDAVRQAISQGVTVVVAAGNWGPEKNTIASPGVVAEAITVGASQKDDFSSQYSSRGPADYIFKPDVYAPGGDVNFTCCDGTKPCCKYPQGVFSAIPSEGYFWTNWEPFCKDFINDYYMRLSGTSMATPHVAGAAAIIKQMHPDWVPAQIKSALVLTATPIIREKAASCKGSPHDCNAHSGDANHDGNIDPSDVLKCTESLCSSTGLPNNICYGQHAPCSSYNSNLALCIAHGCSWAVSPTYEDVGRIDVFESLNASIWTSPSILSMGAVGVGDTQVRKDLIVANAGMSKKGIRLVGDSNFVMQFSANDFCLQPSNKNTVTITIDISSLALDYYTGRLKVETFPNCNFGSLEKTYYLPFNFLKMREVRMNFNIQQYFTPEYVGWFWRIKNKADGTFESVDLTQIDSDTYHFYTNKEEFDLYGFIEQKNALSPTAEKYNFFARRVDLRGKTSLDLYFNTNNVNTLSSNAASIIQSKNMETLYNEIDFGTGNIIDGAFNFIFYDYNSIPLGNIVLGVDVPSDTYFKDYFVNVKPIAVEDINLWRSGLGKKILILPFNFSYPFTQLTDNILDSRIKNSTLTFFNSVKNDNGFKIGFYPYSASQDLSYLSYIQYTNLSLPSRYEFLYRENCDCLNCKYLIKIMPYLFSDLNFYVESWNGQSDINQPGSMPSEITFFEKPFDFNISLYGSTINGYLLDYDKFTKKLNVETSTISLKVTNPSGAVSYIYTQPDLSWWGSLCQGSCPTGNYKVDFDSSDMIVGMKILATATINYDGSTFHLLTISRSYQTGACTGNINFLYPESAYAYSTASAVVNGITNCYFNTMGMYKSILIKQNSCTNTNIACSIAYRQSCETYGCSCQFTTLATTGTYNYYACIDKNNNGVFSDTGESAMKTLQITNNPAKCLGDVDGNIITENGVNYKTVQLTDLVTFARAYGSNCGKNSCSCDLRWNPDADLNGDYTVNLQDLVTLAQHYGWKYDMQCNFIGHV